MGSDLITPASGISIALAVLLAGAGFKIYQWFDTLRERVSKLEIAAVKTEAHERWIHDRKIELAEQRGIEKGKAQAGKTGVFDKVDA